MHQHGDDDLAILATQGDQGALEQLFLRHQASLRAMVARSVFDPEDVHDIVQEAFIDVLKGLHTWDEGRPFLPWMRVICRNRMIRFLKQRPASGVPLEIAEVVVPETEAKPFDAAVVGGLRDCLDRLETRQRQIIEWRYLHNHDLADIAGIIGKNANATAVYIHRLRKKLLACLRSQGFTA